MTVKGSKKIMDKIEAFREYLQNEEKARATVLKYMRDVNEFFVWLGETALSRERVLEYKALLCERYAPASVNAALASLNRFFGFLERYDLRVKSLKIQKTIFSSAEKEIGKNEYERLVQTADKKKNERLSLVLQTIASTGIRISELSHMTVQAISQGMAEISCKGKYRRIFLPKKLCKLLKEYAKKQKIKSGPVFVTKNGKPLDRSNIWTEMKKLCRAAGVSEKKVFPHNLRHLFARTYYKMHKDVVRLADILGHSSVNTTRIYTMESGETHRSQIEKLGFLRC